MTAVHYYVSNASIRPRWPWGPAPYESKGIGESSNIPVAGAIANADFDAVGVRITDLPVTADKVLAGLRATGGN